MSRPRPGFLSLVTGIILIFAVVALMASEYPWPSSYQWPNVYAAEDAELAKPPRPYMLVFTARGGWCPPCNQVKPELENMAKHGWKVSNYPDCSGQLIIIDVDKFPHEDTHLVKINDIVVNLTDKITGVPTFVKIEKSMEVRRHVGYGDQWKIGSTYLGRDVTPYKPF